MLGKYYLRRPDEAHQVLGASQGQLAESSSWYQRLSLNKSYGADLIKPDLIGVHGAESHEKRHWVEVLVPVEVKDNGKEAITQLATYARAIGSCPDHRAFILGITLNHISMHARFVSFSKGLCDGRNGLEEG